ncbi:hypothetical protein FA15DRAFT_204047 [Coprinopsis marcescibilis]|uniref:Uncharacterized protein n=1 Tax=Coprinopsis marcescibilis TaxID=230819 RepID=A0A5C3LB14_COPMA|nr:hypothetical protein FA15DRAFT_204047 [Coprinopsis marcescibilis]
MKLADPASNLTWAPYVECFIDGLPLADSWELDTAGVTNNARLCNASDLTPTLHNLSLQVMIAWPEVPFWLDRLWIIPVENNTYPDSHVMLGPLDSAIYRIAGELEGTSSERYTDEPGSTILVTFNGTRATWMTRDLPDTPAGMSFGVYEVDDNPPVDFKISRNNLDAYYRPLFETDTLPPGEHNMNVTYHGFATPLVLAGVWIENGDIMSPGEADPSIFPGAQKFNEVRGNNTIGPESPPPPSSNVGPIVGGVVGGVVILLLLAGLVIYFLKRRKESNEKKAYLEVADQFEAFGYRPGTLGQRHKQKQTSSDTVDTKASYYSVPAADPFEDPPRPAIYVKTPIGHTYPPGHEEESPTEEEIAALRIVENVGTSRAPRIRGSLEAKAHNVHEGTRVPSMRAVVEGPAQAARPRSAVYLEQTGLGDNVDPPGVEVEYVQHNDSGARRVSQRVVVDLPPTYTPM